MIEIDRVQPRDLGAIGQLHAHFWGSASDEKAMAETLARLSADPDHVLLAARVDGTCVGTATGVVCHGLYGGSDTYLVIEDVVVDPAFRRRGIASALLAELESMAKSQSCNQMVLLSETCREDARALYLSAGFAARWTGFKKKL